jgi:hypothetical protein
MRKWLEKSNARGIHMHGATVHKHMPTVCHDSLSSRAGFPFTLGPPTLLAYARDADS